MIGLFFDTETTGLKKPGDPFVPGLVQLGAIMQNLDNGVILAEVNLICTQPTGSSIPKGASDIHGITDDVAARFGVDPKLIDITFAALIKMSDVIIAHNIDYDLDVVKDNMPHSQGRIMQKQHFCTMESNIMQVKAPLTERQKHYFTSKGMKPDAPYKRPNLTETHIFYFGEAFEGAHDAMADIRACRDVFLEMKQQNLVTLDGEQVALV